MVVSHMQPPNSSCYKEGGNVINLGGYCGTLIGAKIHHVGRPAVEDETPEKEKNEKNPKKTKATEASC